MRSNIFSFTNTSKELVGVLKAFQHLYLLICLLLIHPYEALQISLLNKRITSRIKCDDYQWGVVLILYVQEYLQPRYTKRKNFKQ